MTKVKIEDLTDEQLDYFCAIAQGWIKGNYKPNVVLWKIGDNQFTEDYCPTTNATQCMEIMELEKINVKFVSSGKWEAYEYINYWHIGMPIYATGATAKQSIIRCFIKYKLGDSVDIKNDRQDN